LNGHSESKKDAQKQFPASLTKKMPEISIRCAHPNINAVEQNTNECQKTSTTNSLAK
jgi:hypothetical protein